MSWDVPILLAIKPRVDISRKKIQDQNNILNKKKFNTSHLNISLTLLNITITIRFIQAADMDIKSLVLETVQKDSNVSHFEVTWYITKVTETR